MTPETLQASIALNAEIYALGSNIAELEIMMTKTLSADPVELTIVMPDSVCHYLPTNRQTLVAILEGLADINAKRLAEARAEFDAL